jgi:hypothetical protein
MSGLSIGTPFNKIAKSPLYENWRLIEDPLFWWLLVESNVVTNRSDAK